MTLAIRRKVCDGELGGERKSAYASSAFLVFLWVMYILLSIIRAQGTNAESVDMSKYSETYPLPGSKTSAAGGSAA